MSTPIHPWTASRRPPLPAPSQSHRTCGSARLESGDLVVEVGARRAVLSGSELQLKPREFDLLTYFLRYPGQVLKRDRLLRNVWGYESAGDTRTVDVHVRWLRGKIEDDPNNPTRIQTVRGVGYMFTS